MSMDKENTFYVLDKNGEFQEIGQMDSLPDVGDHTSDARRMLENPLKTGQAACHPDTHI